MASFHTAGMLLMMLVLSLIAAALSGPDLWTAFLELNGLAATTCPECSLHVPTAMVASAADLPAYGRRLRRRALSPPGHVA